MSEDLLEFAREIAQRASRRERETWRALFRRFAAMTPDERESFLKHLDDELDKERKKPDGGG